MTVLVVQIPPRPRAGWPGGSAVDMPAPGDSGAPGSGASWLWMRSETGAAVQSHGHAPVAQLPAAEAVVAVVPEQDVSWHYVAVPRAPAGKMRAALLGVLEDNLLADPEQLHVALAPQAEPGAKAWVAVMDRPWLADAILQLERHGLLVDRVVPALWPGETPHGHFYDAAAPGQEPEPAIAMADANGIVCLPLAGTLARALLPPAAASTVRWTAPPPVAAAAERWLGAPVGVQGQAERLLVAARSTWNLRQFDLVVRRRGSLAVRDAFRRFLRPTWKPVRIGLAALLALQVVGLNVWAWSQEAALDDKREQQVALLMSAFPKVRLVRDPAAQMERETDVLRAAAGQPGPGDFETLLSAAAAAWPENQGPMQALRFQSGQLTLTTSGWSAAENRQFAERLRAGNLASDFQNGRVVITRSTAP